MYNNERDNQYSVIYEINELGIMCVFWDNAHGKSDEGVEVKIVRKCMQDEICFFKLRNLKMEISESLQNNKLPCAALRIVLTVLLFI